MFIYPSSRVSSKGITLQMVEIREEKQLLITNATSEDASGSVASGSASAGEALIDAGFRGNYIEGLGMLCPLDHGNRIAMNRLLPYTVPTAFGRKIATFGTGDRLGLATPGHILAFSDSEVKPVLAQQSKRELTLTGRTYEQVLDDVCFFVFQEGYRGGFGADGDHLKYKEDIKSALDDGYTMITLDCSEKIGNIARYHNSEHNSGHDTGYAEQHYMNLAQSYRSDIESRYLGAPIKLGNQSYSYTREDLIRCALLYNKAVDYTEEVYREIILPCSRPIDLELSVDETESVTTGLDHLFIATELSVRGVEIASLAPRFVGEFQKGIDYIGDAGKLAEQVELHSEIARSFGYKLSIHSGSDKFSVFPLIGQSTEGLLHLKTSGTSWLEAVRIIAEHDPVLYRRMHRKALEHFEEAKKFYNVSSQVSHITALELTADEDLPAYLENDGGRQLMHITYGFMLEDQEMKKDIYRALQQHKEAYTASLAKHIGRHLETLGLRRIKNETR